MFPSSKLLQEECGKRLFLPETVLSLIGISQQIVIFFVFGRSAVDTALNSGHFASAMKRDGACDNGWCGTDVRVKTYV
jgi:hypothetical protein